MSSSCGAQDLLDDKCSQCEIGYWDRHFNGCTNIACDRYVEVSPADRRARRGVPDVDFQPDHPPPARAAESSYVWDPVLKKLVSRPNIKQRSRPSKTIRKYPKRKAKRTAPWKLPTSAIYEDEPNDTSSDSSQIDIAEGLENSVDHELAAALDAQVESALRAEAKVLRESELAYNIAIAHEQNRSIGITLKKTSKFSPRLSSNAKLSMEPSSSASASSSTFPGSSSAPSSGISYVSHDPVSTRAAAFSDSSVSLPGHSESIPSDDRIMRLLHRLASQDLELHGNTVTSTAANPLDRKPSTPPLQPKRWDQLSSCTEASSEMEDHLFL